MSEIFATIQANIIPITIMLIVIGVCVNLLKGLFKVAVIVAGGLVLAYLLGIR